MEMEDEAKPMLVPAPQPKRPVSKPGVKTAICPKCGQAIPLNEMEEHMKIELAGASRIGGLPRAKPVENKQASLAEGDEIAATLRGIAERRTDIFGVNDDEVEIGRALQIDEEKRRRAAMAAQQAWDGHIASADRSAEFMGKVRRNDCYMVESTGLNSIPPSPLVRRPCPNNCE